MSWRGCYVIVVRLRTRRVRPHSQLFELDRVSCSAFGALVKLDVHHPTPDSRLPTPDSRLPTPDSRLPTPDSRLPTPDSRLPTPGVRCCLMKIGYQGEGRSYSDRAVNELFPDGEHCGFTSFAFAFHALRDEDVSRLVLPIENSTTGSVLPVLDRLTTSRARIVGEHLVEVRHALIGVPGATVDQIKTVRSHPQALAQADDRIEQAGWLPIPTHDTAGAVRLLAEHRDPSEAALAPPESAKTHGLVVLASNFMDRDHNTTRFVVLALEPVAIADDANKTSFVFATAHTPGALALSLTELGLRGANLTRLESRPAHEAWKYRFFADMVHQPGEDGLKAILEPQPANMTDVRILGTYPAAQAV